MTIVGKVLAFLNILGVAGFICLAAMVWGKQQTWQYANFRYDLLMDGLPLNDKERDKQEEQSIAERVGNPKEPTQTLKELFPQGQPVSSQVMEVERVYGVLAPTLQQVEKNKEKHLALLAQYLKPLASDFRERERLVLIRVNLADDDKAKSLKTALQQAVQPALAKMKQDEKEYAAKGMEAKPERRKRPFEQAYLESVQSQAGPPRNPFVEKLLAVLPREGGKKYAEAVADLGDRPSEEAFLQAVRNEPGKSFQDLFDAAYAEMLAKLDAELDQRLQDHYQEALVGKRRGISSATTSSLTALSPPEQKRAVARYLFNLVEVMPGQAAPKQGNLWDDPSYKRVINVVGLRTIGKEIEQQARLYQSMLDDLTASISRDHNDFTVVHQDLLEQIKDRSTQVYVLNALVQRIKDMADEKEKLVDRRKVDVNNYNSDLDKVRQDTADQLVELRRMSDQLFKIRVQVRDANRMNQAYERQINALEDRVR